MRFVRNISHTSQNALRRIFHYRSEPSLDKSFDTRHTVPRIDIESRGC